MGFWKRLFGSENASGPQSLNLSSPPRAAQGGGPTRTSTPNRELNERDNLGTRYETHEKVQAFWMPYFTGRPDFPFIFCDMPSRTQATDAMLSLTPFKIAADSGKIVCTDALQFGVYPQDRGKWGFFIAGQQITPELFVAATASCKKYGGTDLRVSDPPKSRAPVASAPMTQTASSVTFDWEEKVDILKQLKARGITIEGGGAVQQFSIKRHYKGPNQQAAMAFLKANRVDKPLYYLVVHTPDGDFGRDKDGIYEVPG